VLKHCCDVRLVKHCERFVCLAYPRDGAGDIMFFGFIIIIIITRVLIIVHF